MYYLNIGQICCVIEWEWWWRMIKRMIDRKWRHAQRRIYCEVDRVVTIALRCYHISAITVAVIVMWLERRSLCLEFFSPCLSVLHTRQSCLNSYWQIKILFSSFIGSLVIQCVLKTIHLTFDHNFGKYSRIIKILLLTDFRRNSLCNHCSAFRLALTVLLHYLVKLENNNCCRFQWRIAGETLEFILLGLMPS